MIPKYRAWDKRQNVMRDVAVLHFTKSGKINSIEYWKTPSELKSYHVRNIELMQSRGKNDKNGVEIFESYIVKNISGGYLGIVVIEDGAFKVKAKHSTFDLTDNRCSSVEVVGNIWENP